MDKFLSCDWGTSSLRLRLVQTIDLMVVAEEKSDSGIAETFKSWQLKGGGTAGRMDFYKQILAAQINDLSHRVNLSLSHVPVILSGMASATIGMIDLPYKRLPFNLDGSDITLKTLATSNGSNPLIIISGAQTDQDVMRGEETKIIGCETYLTAIEQEQLLILPGTHSKHVSVKNNQAVSLKTFMTGEFFGLLSTNGVLAASVEKGGDFNDAENQLHFGDGVKAAQTADLLHTSFMVRTNQVLKHVPKQQNYYYLSGLLIGAELKGLKLGLPIYLVCGASHLPYYTMACQVIGIRIAKHIDADDALINGQRSVFLKHHLEIN
ncbi:MAG: 2-dehydro-3-deoxygalactonokinase [Sphingobacteriaceae bacterium]